MFDELFVLAAYLEEPATAVYEDDLVRRYGQGHVRAAIAGGTLESFLIPCAREGERAVCRLAADPAP